ncbi:formate C-acetyltransferase [Defluviitalea raffinosedens]|uniref:Formate acetyltransferase n=1 Tax=Defluviitalea raffinosedens TaxID=1450156 RepID=A0A7C8LDE5_9FIRM|nr:formate C-acetyltransferase [Defluviitalea raffinosedens]KAE9631378.1 formate C-acetyltransferase [Defluviitalea raffinosedens]
MQRNPWKGFSEGVWQEEINVRDFIQKNYSPYEGNEEFLEGPTERTKVLLKKYTDLCRLESERGGVLDIDTTRVSSLLTYPPGYLDKENEIIVGLQTDAPLKRGVNPFGGIRMTRQACEAYGYKLDQKVEEHFEYRTTHNDGVFRVYTDEMRKARKSGVITGLPDAYGRGRIIGDYRRVPLYGVDFLIEEKKKDKAKLGKRLMDDENIRLSEELYRQIDFLEKLKQMAQMYGYDISKPASNSKEAVQWLYFAYLGAIKEQNGAAMSLGRVSTFLDIYFERDLRENLFTEAEIQEIVDDFVLKLRMARELRTPEYNELFAGDPLWITESIGGMGEDGRTLVTKTSYRFLHTLYNLGPAPEPNLTVLWSKDLPKPFKRYCSRVSIETDSIQYENDDIMREIYGDDYAIACCVSAMRIGKQMQFFGARCNLPKVLLMSLNGGVDEITKEQIGPSRKPISRDILSYEEVMDRFSFYRKWLCELYVNTMNVIHYMHDKYAYEKLQMALHDTEVERFMAFGVAGLSVVADSLSAIKYAKVSPIRDENGLIIDFEIEGDFPKYGNDDERVDSIAKELVKDFYDDLKKIPAYRNAKHTLSILTITSNVVYGKKTGNTPDGRKKGEPFAPGANPMHNRDTKGALASLNSVAKIPYDCCRDGISCTFSVEPNTLGKTEEARIDNLTAILDGYFAKGSHHLNVNVLNREKLLEAMEHPEKYPNLTIRVSGYAVNFHKLSKEQQEEVISRTFHGKL